MSSQTITLPFCRITLSGEFENHLRFFNEQFFALSLTPEPLITINIECQPVKLPELYTQLESSTAFDGKTIFLFDANGKVISFTPNALGDSKISLTVDPDFDSYYLYNYLLEPIQVIWGAHHGVSFIHASGLYKNQQGILFPAWRNTGKTNIMLSALNQGYGFLGDDYCVVHFNTVFPYPKKINLFSYNIAQYPQLLKKLPVQRQLTISFSMGIKKLLQWLAGSSNGVIAKILHRLAELAEVATNFKLDPHQLSDQGVHQANLHQLTVIQRGSHPGQIATITNAEMRTMLSQIISYELIEFMELYQQIVYLTQKPWPVVTAFEKNYLSSLQDNIQSTRARVTVTQSTTIDSIV